MPIAQVYLVQLMVGSSNDDAVTSDKIIFACYSGASFVLHKLLYSKQQELSIPKRKTDELSQT